jgi:hypothetical protein
MNEDRESRKVSANSKDELNKEVNEMIGQGWETEGGVISNPDGTFSQNMRKR